MQYFAALSWKIWLPPAQCMFCLLIAIREDTIYCIALHTVVLAQQVAKWVGWAQCVGSWQRDRHCTRFWVRGKETIYLHRSGALLVNGLDRPKNCYGRYGLSGFYSISISTAGVDEAGVFLWKFSFLALWVVVVDISQFPVGRRCTSAEVGIA